MTRTNGKRRFSCPASFCPKRRLVHPGPADPAGCGLCEDAWRHIERTSGLSDCETEVLQGIADGEPDKRIAKALGTSSDTVRTHIERLGLKLGGTTRVELVVAAFRQHLAALRQEDPPFRCPKKWGHTDVGELATLSPSSVSTPSAS
jgi:DNA-binding CsgD family transcriptional regulator